MYLTCAAASHDLHTNGTCRRRESLRDRDPQERRGRRSKSSKSHLGIQLGLALVSELGPAAIASGH